MSVARTSVVRVTLGRLLENGFFTLILGCDPFTSKAMHLHSILFLQSNRVFCNAHVRQAI